MTKGELMREVCGALGCTCDQCLFREKYDYCRRLDDYTGKDWFCSEFEYVEDFERIERRKEE